VFVGDALFVEKSWCEVLLSEWVERGVVEIDSAPSVDALAAKLRARAGRAQVDVVLITGGEAAPPLGADEPASRSVRHDETTVVSGPLKLGAEELRALEALLTQHVGPVAKLLVKQSARLAADVAALASALAKYVPTEETRKAFIIAAMEKLSSAAVGAAADGPTVRFSRNLIDASQIEIAAKRLARYVGPIARVVAKKTPGRPTDLRAYYRQLAENIPEAADRMRFLKDAGYDK